ncbi:hypothetical protein HK104_008848 [Borealophlyctis nickersoniae]|nr:hypothetical protein HK104_008848 [Borealophlyctis nickersoniae]
MLLEPLYAISDVTGNVGHQIIVGNPFLFGNLPPYAGLQQQTLFVDFMRPILELVVWAVNVIRIRDGLQLPANNPPVAANLAQYLSEFEANNRPAAGAPRELSHVRLCPGRTGRGLHYTQFDFWALCNILGHGANPPIVINDPAAPNNQMNLSRTGLEFSGQPGARLSIFFQLFDRTKLKSLRVDPNTGNIVFRNGQQDLAIDKMSLVTNGYTAKLIFEVQAGPQQSRRIPTMAELQNFRHPSHREFRRVENPDVARGALH